MSDVIESGIPMPKRGVRTNGKYPFADMSVGDSFFIPGAKVSTLRSSCAAYRRKNADQNLFYLVRQDTKRDPETGEAVAGVRVWRAAK